MAKRRHPFFAREGRAHIFICGALALAALFVSVWVALPLWLLLAFVLQFFRDPARRISDAPGAVVAPASGRVVAIGEVANPYLEGAVNLKVSIFMNVFSVHSNLIPVGGEVRRVEYHAGKFLNAALDKAALENERNAICIATERGEQIVCVQIAGLIARRILCYIKPGARVATGERYGFIRFGSRVDLYLPPNAQLQTQLGQKVESGNDVIARLPRG